jgi:hypothetical protein
MSCWRPVYVPEIGTGRHVKNNACTVKIKIKWMIRKDMTYENTYHDDIFALPNLAMLTARLHREFILRGINLDKNI